MRTWIKSPPTMEMPSPCSVLDRLVQTDTRSLLLRRRTRGENPSSRGRGWSTAAGAATVRGRQIRSALHPKPSTATLAVPEPEGSPVSSWVKVTQRD